jgi:indolepyruvate ferredoxin oxidoreductase, beta subunit
MVHVASPMEQARPLTLLVCALGGEGGGVLTEWLVDTARESGYACQSTSIPGVAQRTGATTYYLEVFPVPLSQLDGRRPAFSLNPAPGALDAIVSSELLETARQVGNGMSTPDRTLVITSSQRSLTTQERMQLADGRADSAELLKIVRSFSRAHHVLDMAEMARQAGTAVSAVMLGAIAGSGMLPFAREAYEGVVRRGGGRSAEPSLRGFECGFEAVRQPVAAAAESGLRVGAAMTEQRVQRAGAGAPEAAHAGFPVQVQDMLALGHARMLEYQGPGYARLYLERMRCVLAAERQADPAGAHAFAITREMARWLALWMAFDDIVRVADLKTRGARWQRVQSEVGAGGGDLLRVYDHFKPGAPEVAALLPRRFAERVLRWDRQRVQAGKQPWGMPLKIATHSVAGMLMLRALARLKWLRPHGSRHAAEQAMIEKWLSGVVQGSGRAWRLGHEIALCGRLIKGYGATNERGKDNLLHVLDHLANGPSAAAAAQAIAAARNAALSDEAGVRLDAVLAQHGAPPRPVRAQPIRWARKPRGLSP